MTLGKYPKCECAQKRYTYFRKRYRNQTLHLIRSCAECGKTAQNPMRQQDYDKNWVSTLPIVETGVIGNSVKPNLQSRADTVKSKVNTAQSRANPVQPRADAIHQKLQKHIENRNANL